MRFKHCMLASSAVLVAGLATSAQAQTSANTIAELVVTAEKREQSLQDVPVAISAFTSEQRDIVGIQSIQDMTNFTPGLQYSTSTDRVSLRGLGRLTNVLSADASVANYADGVYETFAVRAGSSTLFLDRVEILRGPQGTLYGRNAIAGAINIISRRPTDSPYAEVRATYGNYNRSVLEGAVSGPINDQVKARLAVNWERQSKGWIKNTIPGFPSEGNVIDSFYAEAQIDVKFNEKLEMWSKFGYTNWRHGAGGPGSQSAGWTPEVFNLDGSRKALRSATNPNGADSFDLTEFYSDATHFNPGFGCSGLAQNVVLASPDGCTNASYRSPWLINRPITYNVRVPNAYTVASHWTYHADNFDIRYILGGVRYWYHLKGSTPGGSQYPGVLSYRIGAAGTQIYPGEQFDYQERNGFISNELNLVSTTEGPFQWIAGAYYYHQHYRQPVHTIEDPRQTQWSISPPFGVCLNGVGAAARPVACAPGIGRRFDNRPSVSNTSYAFYGQVSYDLGEAWTFTGGLRYSHDRKYGTEKTRILCLGLPACLGGLPPEFFLAPLDLTGVNTVVAGGTGLGIDVIPKGVEGATFYDGTTGLASRKYDASWSAVTGTAKVEWHPDPDTLGYASYARGYRSGGFNIGIFTVLSFLPYSKEETVDAFELGLKKTWGQTLQTNVALYHYDYSNLQIPISVVQTGSLMGQTISQGTTSFYNTPKSRSQGVEVEVLWQPIENLQIIANYSYIDAEIRKGFAVDTVDPTASQPNAKPIHTLAQCQAGGAAVAGDCVLDEPTVGLPGGGFQRIQSLKGNDLPNAPRNKIAIAANYTWNFEPGSLTASLSYSWRDHAYGSLFQRWYNRSPTWDQVDARLLWRDANDKFEIIGFVKNIFDDIGYDQGATGRRIDGQFTNLLYGPNPAGTTCSPVAQGASNPAAGNIGTIYCVQGISKTYYTTPPRTYGLELRYKFF
ncbi:MAG: TonB-dependent receptor [Phenylobacterium sp.]|uniref:TonB-dependent receptor n=1 Tax=Phenylobacterium sp. TaxID=1871053 RepID=UPI001A4BA3FD|nr:TonB-dependent receptor [Phenylobacterium sp.]MBL8771850.1 TonB-dependent receptor [Phenylobacterium sp.]